MLAVRTPGALQTARVGAACGSAFPLRDRNRLLRSRSISGSLDSAYNVPVYASQWPLPVAPQDLVRCCSLALPRPSLRTADFNALARRNPPGTDQAVISFAARAVLRI